MSAEIIQLLRERLPIEVAVHACRIGDHGLSSIPRDLIPQSAGPKRLQEFVAGRIAASRALAQLGVENWFPPVGSFRQPVWPPDLIGSISHDDHLAIAICSKQAYRGLGLDIETVSQLGDDIRGQVLSDAEREEPDWRDNLDLLRVFSFKEAVFKCAFPLTGDFLDFADVEIEQEQNTLQARCVDANRASNEVVSNVRGFAEQVGDRVLSVCWLLPEIMQN